MQYLRVVNFEHYQHYKDRMPPWIKLYNKLLDDFDFMKLPDAEKWHLLAIWLLASRTDNRIEFDDEWIQMKIGTKEKVNLQSLISRGFLEVYQDASNTLASCTDSDDVETETETETEKETEEIACAETPEASSSPKPTPHDPIVLTFPCDGKPSEWHLTESKLAEYRDTYRTIDASQEALHARQWCRDNPGKRKTARGMPAFLTNWFNRAVNRPGAKVNGATPKRPTPGTLPVTPPDLQPVEARKFEQYARELRAELPSAQTSTITTMAMEKLQRWKALAARARAPADVVTVDSELGNAAKQLAGMMGK